MTLGGQGGLEGPPRAILPDFFFCAAPQSERRWLEAIENLSRWREAKTIRLTVLQAEPGEAFSFQKERRVQAEKDARSDLYVLADDDVLPTVQSLDDWLTEGFRILKAHPQFAILSPLPVGPSSNIVPWTPPDFAAYEDSEVMEHHAVGTFRFVRRGCIITWPKQLRRGYDQEHSDVLRARGWKVGYLKHLAVSHPGRDFSEAWNPPTGYHAPKITLDSPERFD